MHSQTWLGSSPSRDPREMDSKVSFGVTGLHWVQGGAALCSPNLRSSHQTQQEGADWASSAPEEFTSRGETGINRQLLCRVEQHTGPTSPCKPRPCGPCSESGAEDQSSIRVMDGSGLSSLQPSTPTTDTSFLALQSEAVQHRFPTPIKATAVGSECQRPTVCRCRDPDRDTYWAARSPHSPGDRRGG